jgi:hypothetical protein
VTPREVAKVLAKAAVFDQRNVDAPDVAAWQETIGDLAFGDAIQAVSEHYRATSERITPAELRRVVHEAVAARNRAGDEGWVSRSCGRADCTCTHGYDPVAGGACDRGWIEIEPSAEGNPQVLACHTCRPERHDALRGDRRVAARKLREQRI